MKAVLVALLAMAGCRKKGDEPAATAQPEVVDNRAAPPNADALIREARTRGDASMGISHVQANYVRADGTMDPSYGRLDVTLLGPPPAPPADDPSRPTGAPVTKDRSPACDQQTWTVQGGWGAPWWSCMAMGHPVALHCSILAVWSRAIADGAPRDALAKLTLETGFGEEITPVWSLSIHDEPRNVSFDHDYPDDCAPTVEAPPR